MFRGICRCMRHARQLSHLASGNTQHEPDLSTPTVDAPLEKETHSRRNDYTVQIDDALMR